MRHRKAGSKFNRTSSHRDAMFRNMVTSLVKHDRITTTDARAKELRGLADHLITLAKRGDLHARRQAMAIVNEKDVVHKLFETAKERFGAVSGGYTRIVKVGFRPGDAAMMSIIEFVTPEAAAKTKPVKKKKAAKKAAPEPQATVIAKEAPVEAAEAPAAEAQVNVEADAAEDSEAPEQK
ncbi:MAG: 50S ribosomal protein L17 [Pseudomonadota bacterium]